MVLAINIFHELFLVFFTNTCLLPSFHPRQRELIPFSQTHQCFPSWEAGCTESSIPHVILSGVSLSLRPPRGSVYFFTALNLGERWTARFTRIWGTALKWQLLLPGCLLLESSLLEPSCHALRSPRPVGRPQVDALVDSSSCQPVSVGGHGSEPPWTPKDRCQLHLQVSEYVTETR